MSEELGPIFDYVAVDTETTGLDPQKNEILEITAIEFNLSGLMGRKITKMCRPVAGFIPQEATAIHGITYDMVKDCPAYLSDKVREEIAEFIRDRTVVGHNLISFDSNFIRISFKKVKDTLQMCRAKFNSGNKLKSACKRINIKWDDSASHRSEYDTMKCIELFCKMTNMNYADQVAKEKAPLFTATEEIKQVYSDDAGSINNLIKSDSSEEAKLGIIPTEKDKQFLATQTYSYSRINLFNQCPFKWYMQYIKGFKEPDKDYFQTGKICHKVAEWAGEWCYKELFKNKFVIYMRLKKNAIDPEIVKILTSYCNKSESEITTNYYNYMGKLAEFVYENPKIVCVLFPEIKHLADLIYVIDKSVDHNTYEKPSIPDLDTYNKIIEQAINYYKCENPDVINEVKNIMNRFYTLKDYSLTPGDLTITEKRMVFDKEWNSLKDFYANNAFFRGIIDVISYFGDCVIITDYKSSRKMMTLKQLKEDHQTMVYVLLVYKFLPKGSFNKIIVRIEYIRYGEIVEYEINNPEEIIERALMWINSSIQNIEKEILKTDGTAFRPVRNEYCHSCFLGEEGMCPLFNKMISGRLDDPFACSVSTMEECRAAWKRIETNKAENERLSKLCKSFVKECSDPISIDINAKLDFYLSKHREFDPTKTTLLLLKKNVDMNDFIRNYSISASELQKVLDNKNIKLTEEELNSISVLKSKSTFDAFTVDEAKAKGFINP